MRRFLLSFLFVGALSAVFSFSAFADTVTSGYNSTGEAVYLHTVSFSNINAQAGDVWSFLVNVNQGYNQIIDPSGRNIINSVSGEQFNFTCTVEAMGSSYDLVELSTEGFRVWCRFKQAAGSISFTVKVTYAYTWFSGRYTGSPTIDLNTCVARNDPSVTFGSISKSLSEMPSVTGNSSKLDQILDILNGDSSELKDESFLLNDRFIAKYDTVQNVRITHTNGQYYTDYAPIELKDQGTSSNSCVVQTGGLSGVTSIQFLGPFNNGIRMTPGYYDVYLQLRPNLSPSKFTFTFMGKTQSITNGNLIINASNVYVDQYGQGLNINFSSPVSIPSGKLTILLYVYPSNSQSVQDDIMEGAINPDQEGTVSDVDDAGHQQSQQEKEMWQNINSYKGDLSFNLDGWDDAAGGLSYVTGVFMTIWNNSPTQPIVLSLMLGIAMLSIGRGVSAAVRASSRRGDKDA